MSIPAWFLVIIHFVLGFSCAGHALLYKKDSRAAFGWIAVCLGYPVVGSGLYCLFGINRKRNVALRLRQEPKFSTEEERPHNPPTIAAPHSLPESFQGLARLSFWINKAKLLGGNQLTLLENGDAAYRAMWQAINTSQHYIYLSTYIFETNTIGLKFISYLKRAQKRGVSIRVLVDAFGELYSWPHASRLLKRAGIKVARFHEPKLLPFNLHLNLRNHRKILVIDGQAAFTGGMNIGGRNSHLEPAHRKSIHDIHFQCLGPIVAEIERVFIEDWYACTTEILPMPNRLLNHNGESYCRVVKDGPSEEFSKTSMILIGAIAAAKEHIWIMTPYFLPPHELITALQAAALRGVRVTILLPGKNNLPIVAWAMQHILPRLLAYDVHVAYQPAPFVHSKLFLVDAYYTHIGSANLDLRSLRLNFEMGVECYDDELGEKLLSYCQDRLALAQTITQKELAQRHLLIRCRDALCWLFSPYL